MNIHMCVLPLAILGSQNHELQKMVERANELLDQERKTTLKMKEEMAALESRQQKTLLQMKEHQSEIRTLQEQLNLLVSDRSLDPEEVQCGGLSLGEGAGDSHGKESIPW